MWMISFLPPLSPSSWCAILVNGNQKSLFCGLVFLDIRMEFHLLKLNPNNTSPQTVLLYSLPSCLLPGVKIHLMSHTISNKVINGYYQIVQLKYKPAPIFSLNFHFLVLVGLNETFKKDVMFLSSIILLYTYIYAYIKLHMGTQILLPILLRPLRPQHFFSMWIGFL